MAIQICGNGLESGAFSLRPPTGPGLPLLANSATIELVSALKSVTGSLNLVSDFSVDGPRLAGKLSHLDRKSFDRTINAVEALTKRTWNGSETMSVLEFEEAIDKAASTSTNETVRKYFGLYGVVRITDWNRRIENVQLCRTLDAIELLKAKVAQGTDLSPEEALELVKLEKQEQAARAEIIRLTERMADFQAQIAALDANN